MRVRSKDSKAWQSEMFTGSQGSRAELGGRGGRAQGWEGEACQPGSAGFLSIPGGHVLASWTFPEASWD